MVFIQKFYCSGNNAYLWFVPFTHTQKTHLIYSERLTLLCVSGPQLLIFREPVKYLPKNLFMTYGMCQKKRFWSGPEVIKLFSYTTQLSMKIFLLINIKMPTVVGILIFISRTNFMLSSALQEKSLNWWYLIFYKRNKFHSQLSSV